jgi:hypothetical protein
MGLEALLEERMSHDDGGDPNFVLMGERRKLVKGSANALEQHGLLIGLKIPLLEFSVLRLEAVELPGNAVFTFCDRFEMLIEAVMLLNSLIGAPDPGSHGLNVGLPLGDTIL